jgi:MFS family permease
MTPTSPRSAEGAGGAARAGLIILTLINLLNYLDRWVVSALVESIKHSELALSDTQLGALMTGFIIVYMAASPFFGTLGDRGNRPRILAWGVAVWSLFTVLGGFAWSFLSLFAARAAVGIGEAAYGTISPALLADYYPKERRGRVFAIFFCAIPIGSALGYILGGLVDKHFGWRAAFFVAGAPGLVLAFFAWRLFDPPRGSQDTEIMAGHVGGPRPTVAAYLGLLRNRPYLLTVLGYAAYTFAIGGLAFWTPTFLVRMRGLTLGQATITFGGIVVVTGFLGTFAGGYLGDYFLKRNQQAYLWVSGLSTLLSVPFVVVALTHHSPAVYYSAIVVAELLLFASTGPINSAIVNVVNPLERATASALCIFGIHILGDVPSPPIIGLLSDSSDLGRAILIVPIAVLIAGLVWVAAARSGTAASKRAFVSPAR